MNNDLEKAIKKLTEEYERACNSDFVHDPISYALHRTWKAFDIRYWSRQSKKEGK